MTAITYREAAPADATLLVDLFGRSFTETFGHLYRPEDLAAFMASFDEAAWAREIADPALTIRVVEADEVAVGFAKIGPVSLPVAPTTAAMELRQFYLLKPWHGQGIAQALMDWVLDEVRSRKAQEVYLSVYVDNHRARRFYERYGFEFVAPYAFMVGSQADEDLILRLTLED